MAHRFFVPALLLVLLALLPSRLSAGDRTMVIGMIADRRPGAPVNTIAVAAQIAERELNDYFTQTGNPARVRLVVRETEPEVASTEAALRDLATQGIRVIIGPETSQELAAVRPLAAQLGVVLISYASTAPSLAIAGDAVFRLAPDDRLQARAVVELMTEEGVQAVVPIWRGDVYGDDLVAAVRNSFSGEVAAGVRYPADTANFPATVEALGAQVRQLRAAYPAGRVAVYLVSLGEVTALLEAASAVSGLREVAWYGSDGAALDLALVANPTASLFAWETGFVTPIFGEFIDSEQTALVADEIRARTGMAPEAYALTAYDSTMIAGLAAARAGGTANLTRYVAAFAAVANDFFGVTGPVDLNEAGDRASGSYDLWAIDAFNSSLSWLRQATVDVTPGQPGSIDWLERRRQPGRGLPLPHR